MPEPAGRLRQPAGRPPDAGVLPPLRHAGRPGQDDNGRSPTSRAAAWPRAPASSFRRRLLVTNAHVVDEASEVTVAMEDGRELKAEVIGADERTDLRS
jgi:serine protease Do